MQETKYTGINRRAARGFSCLLGVILIFTAVSRAADSFLVPQVAVEQPSSKRIEHVAEAEGAAEAKGVFPVFAESGLLVETVCVQEGAFVAEGEVLARFAEEHLKERIAALENEIAVLALTNEAIEANKEQAFLAREKQRQRAAEDYARIVKKQEAAVNFAKMELDVAERTIDAFYGTGGQDAENMSGGQGDAAAGQQQADVLYQTYFAKKAAYEAALSEQEAAVTAAERAVEDAGNTIPLDNTAEINAISRDEKKKMLDKLLAIYEIGGEICAPKAGTVTGIFVQTGQKTADTAAFTMASSEDGVRFTAEIAEEEAVYVQTGDAVSVKRNGRNYDGFSVTDIETKTDGRVKILVEASNGDEDFSIGDTVTLTVIQQSGIYPLAIPLTALHVETQGAYVYVLREEKTVLGTELFAEKVPVKVLEKNGSYAALEEGTLGMEDQMIIDSDRYIEAGSRVRLGGL